MSRLKLRYRSSCHFFGRSVHLIAATAFFFVACSKQSGNNKVQAFDIADRVSQIRATKSIDQQELVEMGKEDALYRINNGKPTIIVSGGIKQSIPGLGDKELEHGKYEFKYLPTNCADADLTKLWKYAESFNLTMVNR